MSNTNQTTFTNQAIEKGYTRDPLLLTDYCMQLISGNEFKVLMFINRKTLGWNKVSDAIANSQIASSTGMNKNSVVRAIKSLETLKFIIVTRRKSETSFNKANEYSINFEYLLIAAEETAVDQKDVVSPIRNEAEVTSKPESDVQEESVVLVPEKTKKEEPKKKAKKKKLNKNQVTHNTKRENNTTNGVSETKIINDRYQAELVKQQEVISKIHEDNNNDDYVDLDDLSSEYINELDSAGFNPYLLKYQSYNSLKNHISADYYQNKEQTN